MKKLVFIVLIFLLQLIAPANAEIREKLNYEQVYNNLPILDVYFDFREDPDEVYHTHGRFESPYPLFRTMLYLTSQNITLNPGYYLLTPKFYSSYDFIMFKQKGKIVGFVPVYEKVSIDTSLVYKEPQKPKDKLYKRPFVGTKKVLGKPFGRFKKPPESFRSKIETKVTDDGNYFLVWLYLESNLYKMVFKFKK